MKGGTCQLVLLTPPGRGAVATVLLEGSNARDAVQMVFHAASNRPLHDYPPDQLIYGRMGEPPGEEVIVRCRSAESVEVHCHGGTAAVGRLEKLFAEQGFVAVDWRNWISTQETDPFAAAARLALAEARTARTAAILLDQYHGALRREFEAIEAGIRGAGRGARGAEEEMTDNISSVTNQPVQHEPALPINYSLPDSSLIPYPLSLIPHPSTLQRLETLRALIPLGRHLISPWRIVLAGRPNVGKSSLLNALVGYARAIVHEAPGTTRDAVTVQTALDGWPVELCDTAGMRETASPVEQAGVELARQNLREADLRVLIFDGGQPWSPEDQALVENWPQSLLVHNKCDLPESPTTRPPGLSISALTDQGIEGLAQTIAGRLVPHPPPPGAAVPFTGEHFSKITQLISFASLAQTK